MKIENSLRKTISDSIKIEEILSRDYLDKGKTHF
jgi:hypothetical protein